MNLGPFQRILSSMKVQTAAVTAIIAGVALFNSTLPVEQKVGGFVSALCALGLTVIAATGYEDAHKTPDPPKNEEKNP